MGETNGIGADGADSADRRGDGVQSDDGTGLLHGDVTGAVIGGMYIVHGELGAGFFERVYANALCVVLQAAGLAVEREVIFDVMFRGVCVGRYRADIIVERKVVVEVKAGREIHSEHVSQVVNYLRNFGSSAKHKRVIATRHRRRGQ